MNSESQISLKSFSELYNSICFYIDNILQRNNYNTPIHKEQFDLRDTTLDNQYLNKF